MNKDKLEGFLIGIGVGIVISGFPAGVRAIASRSQSARQLATVPPKSPRAKRRPRSRRIRVCGPHTHESPSPAYDRASCANYCIAFHKTGIPSSLNT